MNLADYFALNDPEYDAELHLVWTKAKSPGYHTRIPDGTRAHMTRHAMDYALALLQSGEPARVERANHVLEKIASLQVTEPTDPHYGIWGWYYEEPPRQMDRADPNWADFIGARLAQVLGQHKDQLRPATAEKVRGALFHAAMAIFRRNMGAGYTNIAVMGAVVTAGAGELCGLALLTDYGRQRLGNVLQLTEKAGGFSEYNSPTYTRVLLEELERAALIVRDPAFLEIAEKLRGLVWQALAERFHPGTGQLAGPMSRAYSDWVEPKLARYLREQTGAPILARASVTSPESIAVEEGIDLVKPIPCPPQFASRFSSLPRDPMQITTRFSTSSRGDTIGTTWLAKDACLGSINSEIAWKQRRLLLGYWKTKEDPAVMLRTRMLLNDLDLSAAACRQVQDGPRVLTGWWLNYDSGHFHPFSNKPLGSIFPVQDLRLRIELRGRDVHAQQIDENRFELSAGNWRAIIHTAPASFIGLPARWELIVEDEQVNLDAVLYQGPMQSVDFHQAILQLGHAIELLHSSESMTDQPLQSSTENGETHWKWNDLQVTIPAHPTQAPY